MWIGIAAGDITGIGPEVALKALAIEPRDPAVHYLLIGDRNFLENLNRDLALDLAFQPFHPGKTAGRFFLHDPLSTPLPQGLPCGAPEAARAALTFLKAGADLCLDGTLNALVTAPLNKEAVLKSAQPFIGQTEWLSQHARADRTAMMLLGDDGQGRCLRVALVTTHLPLRQVPEQITQSKIEQTIELTAEACRLLQLPHPRIAVCGLNPHAGEGGQLGNEESGIISPAIAAAQSRGIQAEGPLPADTVFHYAYHGHYQAVVAMYHDQGLPPLKMIGFERGVNWTLGLPFIRTSPDHGTAYNIAGQNKASPSSMGAAIQLARSLASTPRIT
jgi:4-hydroxythreonine-4-phosphate dehydrogenase